MSRRHFEAIIFDLDGTLIDTETADFEACRLLYAELGVSLSLEYWAAKIVGITNGYDELFEELIDGDHHSLSREVLWQRIHQLWSLTLQNMTLMPGAEKLLSCLQAAAYPLGLATASDVAWVNRWLSHFKLTQNYGV